MTDYTELKRLAEAAQYENNETNRDLRKTTADFFAGCIPEQILELIAERDWLKTENEALREQRDARPLFKPFHEPAIGFTGCVICGVYTDHGGLPCPKTRAAAVALSMENQRITPAEPLRVPHPLDAAMGQAVQP